MTENSNPPCVLEIQNVTKTYARNEKLRLPDGTIRRKTHIHAVNGVDLELRPGEILGILGETGCGKSTLGRIITGLEKPTSGEIRLEGEPMDALLKRNRRELRRKVQMIFQNPFDVFDSRFRIDRILTEALKIHNIGSDDRARHAIACDALSNAGLSPGENFMRRYPVELSGGQLQRISIIRSMLLNPAFMVADEPVSMLDISIRADVINMLRNAADVQKTAVIFISHDISTTRYIADRIAVMYLGQIVEIGCTEDVMQNPAHPYTRVLISNCPRADPREPFNPIELSGAPPSVNFTPEGCFFSSRCLTAGEDCCMSERSLIPAGAEGHYVRCTSYRPHNAAS